MSIVLDTFIANLSNIVRPNRFLVYIEPPEGLLDSTVSPDRMKFYVQGATIPDRTFGDIEMKYFGMTYKLAGNESISDLTVTFINDSSWEIRDFFEAWANAVSNRNDSTKSYAADLYTGSSVTVHQIGFNGEILSAYRYYYIFPKVVSEIELNMDTTDSHETFTVTFDYSYFYQLPIEE
jgi:hypothetical protein